MGRVYDAVIIKMSGKEMTLRLPKGTLINATKIAGAKVGVRVKFTYDHNNKRVSSVLPADHWMPDTLNIPDYVYEDGNAEVSGGFFPEF